MQPITRQIFNNLTALGLVQVTNNILPLITLPYLILILGVELYGKLIFVQTVIIYLMLITDYSFNLSATQDISINRNDKFKIAEVVNKVKVMGFIWLICTESFNEQPFAS